MYNLFWTLALLMKRETGKEPRVLIETLVAFQTDIGIANGADFLTPSVNPDGTWPLDMTGYEDIFIAIKPTNGGNVKIDAVIGPDTVSFANLSPVDAAKRIEIGGRNDVPASLQTAFYESSADLTVNVWNIYQLQGMLANQKLLQFKITNNSGGISTIETAFMRLV